MLRTASEKSNDLLQSLEDLLYENIVLWTISYLIKTSQMRNVIRQKYRIKNRIVTLPSPICHIISLLSQSRCTHALDVSTNRRDRSVGLCLINISSEFYDEWVHSGFLNFQAIQGVITTDSCNVSLDDVSYLSRSFLLIRSKSTSLTWKWKQKCLNSEIIYKICVLKIGHWPIDIVLFG